jgi:hypothetical protein
MTKKIINKTSVIILTLLVLLLGGLGYALNQQAFTKENIEKQIKLSLEADTPVGYFPSYENDLVEKYSTQIVQTKYDLLNPVYSVLGNQCIYGDNKPIENCTSFFVIQITLKRQGLTNWKTENLTRSFVDNIEYSKIKSYITLQNIYTNNPDPKNIRNVPPLTPEEIESNRKRREAEEANKIEDKILEQKKIEFDNSSKEEKINVLNENIKRRQGYIDNYTQNKVLPPNVTEPEIQYYLDYLKTIIETDKQQIAELNK